MNCAPGNCSKDDVSCYSKEQLIKIAKTLNKERKLSIKTVSKSKKEIWEQIQNALIGECTYEWCWLDVPEIKKLKDRKLKEDVFKPPMPDEWTNNKYTWLTTTDILKVMKQYEKMYKNFKFYGPVPVDCPKDIYCELTDIDLRKLKGRGIKYVGVVFNLDRHDQSGSHWVGLFCNIPERIISYYDSTASVPPGYIKYFINMLKASLNSINSDKVVCNYNKKKHQFGGSECGIYSMNFILESLKGKKMEDFQKKNITDFSVNILREFFYRPAKKEKDLVLVSNGGKKATSVASRGKLKK